MARQHETFTTETTGLAEAARPRDIRMKDGGHLDITIGSVRKRIGDADIRMLAYNGSIPGPTLYVDQGSEITVEATNNGDVDATVHWHGLRLENRYDGVPEETQAPIGVGGSFTYRVQFPDPGLYWYHPHIARGLRAGDGPLRSDRGARVRPLLLGPCGSRTHDHFG